MLTTLRFHVALLVTALLVTAATGHADQDNQPVVRSVVPPVTSNILVLDDSEPYRPVLLGLVAGIRSVMDSSQTIRPAYFIEALDIGRVGGSQQVAQSVTWLTKKYTELPVDLIIALSDEAITVAEDLRRAWGKDIPIVGLRRDTRRPDQLEQLFPLRNGIQILVGDLDRPTARHIRQLIPGIRELLVIAQVRTDADVVAARMQSVLGASVRVEAIAPPSLAQLRRRFAALPADGAIFYYNVNRDAEGNAWTSREFLRQVSLIAPRPVFGYVPTFVGSGVVGGPINDLHEVGATLAHSGIRLLSGTPSSSMEPVLVAPTRVIYDWQQLERFSIPRERLSPDATFVNRPISIWEEYPLTTFVVGTLIVLLTGTVALLLRGRRQVRLAHQARTVAAQRLLLAQDSERQRIARDLHDDLCQEMTVLALELDRMVLPSPTGRSGPEASVTPADRARQLLDRTREIALGLRGVPVRGMPLSDAITALTANLAHRTGLPIETSTPDWSPSLSAEVTEAMYRAVQEALQNALRHAEATRVVITLENVGRFARVIVADNGLGFDPAQADGTGLGLATMRERMEAIGGHCEVTSTPYGGTTVTLTAPCEEAR